MDLLCYEDLDAFGRELDDPLAELDQDNYHRLIEEPGSNIDDPARGLGIIGWLSRGLRGAAGMRDLESAIEAELLKDDRNSKVRAVVSLVSVGEYRLEIAIVADEGVLGIVLIGNGAGVRRVA